jgi:hypothetical protein
LLAAEKWLVALILKGTEGVEAALEELREEDFRHLPSAGLLRAAKGLYLRNEPLSAASLEAALADEEARRLLHEIAVEDPPVDWAVPRKCVDGLRRMVLKDRLAEIQKELAAASGESLDALLHEKNALSIRIANLGAGSV